MTSFSSSTKAMLAIDEKKTTSTDLYRPLRLYISLNYSDREAQNLEDDLDTLRTLRSNLEKPPNIDPLTTRRDCLLSYFRALCAVESRFPISPDRNHVNSVSFTWYDAFKTSKKASQQSVHFEKAAVLFNLGAVYGQIALSADRTEASGLKQACNSFQYAAGAFAFLRENVAGKVVAVGPATVDVSVECAGMLERLMLAQAQECFFEKVIADGKPSGLCSKVARQVNIYYDEALKALNSTALHQHFERTWISHVQLKALHFYAEACYRAGLELHDKENIAEEIARLKDGINALTDAKKSSKGVSASILDAISRLEITMNRNLERAIKENERVYLMRIPTVGTLAELPAASLVKSISLDEVFYASKERLFANLIPDSSAKALSKYTEMVDDIIRTQAEKLQEGSEITRVKLKEMDLPESILALEGHFSLPVDLKEDVEQIQVIGGPSSLEDELQQLRDLKRVNQELIIQTEELLQKEEREDTHLRTQLGTKCDRPQSMTLTKNLKDRLNKFAANLKQAADSDARLERSARENTDLMAVLDIRPIESALPNIARPIMSLDGNEDAIVGALKQSLRQLETIGAHRAGLEDMLKDMKRKDDILPKLMATTGSTEDLFRKEISKYDPICEEITQNIEVQEQLLFQIQAQNEDFAAVFNLEDYKVSRDRCYKQIYAAVAKFREIKNNISEGMQFYVTLQDAITNVKQQCSDFVTSRNIQFKEMIGSLQKQISSLSFSPDGKTEHDYSSGPVSIPPKTDIWGQRPPSVYNYPSAVQPNTSMHPPVDPRNTPQVYSSPLDRPQMPPQHDPRSQQQVAGYSYPSSRPPNMPPQANVPSANYNYPAGQSVPSANVPQQINPRTSPCPPPNMPQYHQPPQVQSRPGYNQAFGHYVPSGQPPLYGHPVTAGPYQPPQQTYQPPQQTYQPPQQTYQPPQQTYQPPQQTYQPPQQTYQPPQQTPTHQQTPAYAGWNDPYYNNAPQQQSGGQIHPRPPYGNPGSYPSSHQGGY